MTNRSFADMLIKQRRERIAAVLALGLLRVQEQRSKFSANSLDSSLEVSCEVRLSVSQPNAGEPDADDDE
jgi:hypothetical protein